MEFWLSDHCVHGAFTEKNLLPSEVKESHFFPSLPTMALLFLAKTPPFFLLKQQSWGKTLTRAWWYDLAEQFFSHQGLSTFYFQAMGGAKKHSQLFNSY